MLSTKSSRRIITVALAALPFLIYLAFTLETNTDDMLNWVPEDTAQFAAYQRFTGLFGDDDELIVSWEGCLVDDPRLSELEGRLIRANQEHHLFNSIASGESILNLLGDKDFSFPRKTLERRLQHIFFDKEDGTTALILQLSETGQRSGSKCIDEIFSQADATDGLLADDIRIAGNAFTTTQIDSSTDKTVLLAFPAALLAVGFTFFCLRSLRLTLSALVVAGFAGVSSVAVIAIAGAKFNCLLVMLPVLVVVLTFSATIHLCSYYKKCVRAQHPDPVAGMLQIGLRPCMLAVLTTAIGILMLITSHVHAIRDFGMFTAIGLCLSLPSLLILLPAILKFWKPAAKEIEHIKRNSWDNYFSIRLPRSAALPPANFVVAVCLLAIPVFGYGLSQIESRLLAERMFSRDSQVQRNTKWLADKFSSVHSVEVVAEFPKNLSETNLLNEIRQIKTLQSELAKIDAVESTLSIVNFCRIPSASRTAADFIKNDLVNESLRNDIDRLKERRFFAEDDEKTYWRIRLGVDAELASEIEPLMHLIEQRISLAAAELPDQPDGFVTGTWPLFTSGRQHIFDDLASSFVLAFLIITPIIMILTGGVWAGLVAMIPNVFPALAFFGSLGLLGIEIDTGTILTACVGMGIAIDDTLHYLHEYSRIRKEENIGRTLGAISAVSSCIRPMAYTTIVCTLGLSTFVFSEFLPAQNFAIAICVLLSLALVCDILFLPALIIGPLGRFFESDSFVDQTSESDSAKVRPKQAA